LGREKATVAQSGDSLILELPRRLAATWRAGTEIAVTSFGPDAALLLRAGLGTAGHLAASLSAFSVAEAFGYVLSGIRSGKLVVTRGSVRKWVSFREGQVVFAQSSEPWERLGTALVRLRLLTREQLAQALEEVGPRARLGQVLTRSGILSPSQLYGAMTYLVREIVLNLFAETEGELLFLEGLPPSEDGLRLPDPTRELALKGFRRAEEVQTFRRRYPPSLMVARGPREPEEGRDLWSRAAGGASVAELLEAQQGGEHAFFTLLEALLRSGALEIRPAPEELTAPSRLEARPVLERYRELVRTLCRALLQSGQGIEPLRSFLAEPTEGTHDAFSGVTLSDAGELDVERVLLNLGTDAAARARAYDALDAFVWYALFTARNVVPPDEAERLTAEIRRAQEGTT
jgi:hypothetical protein